MTVAHLAVDAPPIDYYRLSPMLVVFAVGVVSVLVEAFVAQRRTVQAVLCGGGLVAAGVMLGFVAHTAAGDSPEQRTVMSGAVLVDGPGLFLQAVILLAGLGSVLFMGERRLDRVWAPVEVRTAAGKPVMVGGDSAVDDEDADLPADAFTPSGATVPGSADELAAGRARFLTTEVYPLTLFAIGGMMLFASSGDLLTMFIALEVLSLPLYVLCGLARRRRLLSQEASLKYFLLGAFSSAVFLFGAAFAYGASASLGLRDLGQAVSSADDETIAVIALVLIAVGLLFKVGAVPFGSWVPDVYQGAPTPVTALMASATKAAAFGALLRVLHVAFPGLVDTARPALWTVAIATMVVGTFLAVTQRDVKRMLAYSSVSHVGFALVGAIVVTSDALAATLFYVAVYAVSAFAAFALLSVVRDSTGREESDLQAWAGLGRKHPLVGAMMSLLLLSFAGIPLTGGFVGKFAVFSAAGEDGAWPLVIVGVVCSAIAAYFYVRVIVAMFFADPPENAPAVVAPSALTTVPVAIGVALTLVLGVVPQWLLDICHDVASFVG